MQQQSDECDAEAHKKNFWWSSLLDCKADKAGTIAGRAATAN